MNEPVLGGFVISRPEPTQYKVGEVKGFRLMSDLHIGAANVDYKLIKAELADAIAKKDRILINGDLYDMILCGDRKRFSPDALHPRLHGRKDIVNESVAWGVELLSPAAHLIDMIGLGNHETAVEHHHSKDVTRDTVRELQRVAGKNHLIHYGGYTGFVDYRFQRKSWQGVKSGSHRYVIYYHHGSGGAAAVTKGLIDFNRRSTYIVSDIIWMGHKHNRLNVHVEQLSCPLGGDSPIVREVRHIMTGAYFNTYCGQSQESLRRHGRRSNYAADSGMAPQGRGGVRVTLTFDTTGMGICVQQ